MDKIFSDPFKVDWMTGKNTDWEAIKMMMGALWKIWVLILPNRKQFVPTTEECHRSSTTTCIPKHCKPTLGFGWEVPLSLALSDLNQELGSARAYYFSNFKAKSCKSELHQKIVKLNCKNHSKYFFLQLILHFANHII